MVAENREEYLGKGYIGGMVKLCCGVLLSFFVRGREGEDLV